MHPAATRSSQATIEQFGKYVIPNYKRYPVCIVHGEGTAVWDAEGKRYLDLFPGWGCNILTVFAQLLLLCSASSTRGDRRSGGMDSHVLQ